jgi:hypothetical protein
MMPPTVGGRMEYFVFANSFAAPFVSDSSTDFVQADAPLDALKKFVADYKHPAGLYFAALFASSDDYHKGRTPLAKWTCNHEIKLAEMRKKGACAFLSEKPGLIQIDGKKIEVEKPKDGSFELCA